VDVPGVTGSGEHASCFKHGEGEVNDGNVREGIITSSRDALNFTYVHPKVFNGIFWGPDSGDACTIVFEFSTSDGAISGM